MKGREVSKHVVLPVLAALLFAASFAAPAGMNEATRIVEMKGGGESLWVFLTRLPGSFEAQVFYALAVSWFVGALGSWLWKWSQGQAEGAKHFTHQYIIGQLLYGVGVSIAAIMTVGFQTEGGEFFGWLSVLWCGGFAGFSGEVKLKAAEAS